MPPGCELAAFLLATLLVVFRPERLEHELPRLESARHVELARDELVHAADRRH
jgi:hypothetical protein